MRRVKSPPDPPSATPWRRVLRVMFVAQVLAAAGFSTSLPFLPNFVTELGSASGASILLLVTLAFSLQSIAMAIAQPFWGALSDRWGRKPMVMRALTGGALLTLAMAFVRSAEELVVLRTVQGLVTGVAAAGTTLVASVAPRERLGYAMGLMQTALWAGVSIGPMLGGVLQLFIGYRGTMVATAVLLLGGSVLVGALVTERFTPTPSGSGGGGIAASLRSALQRPGIAAVLSVRFTAWLGRMMILPFLPLFIAALIGSDAAGGVVTGIAVGIGSAAGTVSSLLFGRWGDWIGHRRMVILGSLATAVAYAPIGFVTQAWQVVALYAATGATVGALMPSMSALLGSLSERQAVGSVYGLDATVVSAARGVAPLLGGALIALTIGTREPTGLDYAVIFPAIALAFALAGGLAAAFIPRVPRATERLEHEA
jgi:MFS transporter, DHA1 family, multidrug resistance protein